MAETGAISLYLDLEPDQKADLEVVARASLAWVAVIREIAASVDPMSEVRVELESGTEGSLSLNSVVRRIRGALPSKIELRVIVLAVMLWMGEKGLEWTYDKVLDALWGDGAGEVAKNLTEDEKKELAEQVVVALRSTNAEQSKRLVFRELERDPSIRGVGVSAEPGARPIYIVPRDEFAARASQSEQVDDEGSRRTVTTELTVVLVSPVLKDAERSWRFQPAALPEFGAVMKDHQFLEALRVGRIAVPFRPGIEMTIELQTKEELIDGGWVVKERNVTRVLSPGGGQQGSFLPTD